ncbi:fluoride efflux transporter CrcB [Flavobacterium psychrophilum]|uniref:Fluoride-specific ion channel FluC n=2 Tax=Flavobacterium psychrophilum TaxID=96345 RepID=FLUC_FLAPJ|nr:fluoride efflux transporter CrcB [Flavobacterium psychrophilum]A6H0J1.1 RecName: Full=Fluoride-specific ion channel FluC [Flavobacterium psychrophilum JIP02/86]AIG30548.1 camphor resistance protein CrcB [Flavobacterium psychrophilum]AIG32823.1 camphor resistance protein CrcB [Flavobacterium psychrophilum]AIG34978.1 camphor resistance protein CrcB [Flavobacterium psychrophilum]AIG37343.1 camphor resistance protein CrcB [Flavobacterium psychrophilum]AIG39607.1 camphor resistance protein CrcB
MKTIFYIALGGGLGSVLRYLTTLVINKYVQTTFPYATFVTNIAGCLLIGLFFGYLEKQNAVSPYLKFFLITGLCGGYTTFSAFSNENIQLLQSNQILIAFLYISLSVFLGLMATWTGLIIAKEL